MAWWALNPDRWQREQEALTAAGISFKVDNGAKARGRLALNLTMEWDGQPLRLVAHFPFNYPYAHPMVVAPELDLVRHQTPSSKQLCLLRHNGKEWQPATDTLASLLLEQLPEIFASQPGGPKEDKQGLEAEPMTAFLQTEQGSFVGFPAFDLSILPKRGTFRLGLTSLRPLRGTVLDVFDDRGRTLFSSEARNDEHFRNRPVVTGRWIQLARSPKVGNAKSYYDLAGASDASFTKPAWQSLPNSKARIDPLALLFPDELTWKKTGGNAIVVSKLIDVQQAKTVGSLDTKLHRVELESRANYFQRDPAAAGLQKGCVSLIGTGSIGSPAAKLLAQSGIGELRLFDHDVLDAGNAIRWELGRDFAGHHKVAVLQGVLGDNFPYTKVIGTPLRVGEARFDDPPGLEEAYDRLFRDVTCVFDASASIGLNNYLADTARQRGVPYVWMYATPGAWGGLVGRASPHRTDFCWMCHLYYLDDQSAELKIPTLRSAPEDEVQPAGCLDPTFVGAQVDLTEVTLVGTRLVIDEVLTQTSEQKAPRYDWNVAALEMRDAAGNPQLPKWTAYKLPRHAKCPNH